MAIQVHRKVAASLHGVEWHVSEDKFVDGTTLGRLDDFWRNVDSYAVAYPRVPPHCTLRRNSTLLIDQCFGRGGIH